MSVGEKNVSLDTLSIGKILLLFISGVVASSSMLLPGISGSFVLMLLGYYYPIVNAIRGLTKFQNLFHNVIILSIADLVNPEIYFNIAGLAVFTFTPTKLTDFSTTKSRDSPNFFWLTSC